MEKLEDRYPELKRLVELTIAKAPIRDIQDEFDNVIKELKSSHNASLDAFLESYVNLSLGGVNCFNPSSQSSHYRLSV